MRWLIRHNHKLGKMFSAPSHAVKGRGYDLGHVDLLLLWREEEVRIEPGSLRRGSVENVKAREEGERFSYFSRFIFLCVGGWMGAGLQVSIEHDRSNILKNKHTLAETHFVILFIAHRVIHSISCAHVCKNTDTWTHSITTTAHHAVTLQLPWHWLYSKQTARWKLRSTLELAPL